jgi:hypothetical protein
MPLTGVIFVGATIVLWGLAEWRQSVVFSGMPRHAVAFYHDSLPDWYAHVATCVGSERNPNKIVPRIAPTLGYHKFINLATVTWDSTPIIGRYYEQKRTIVVRRDHADSGRVWRHEMVHYLQHGQPGHAPDSVFKCAEAGPR